MSGAGGATRAAPAGSGEATSAAPAGGTATIAAVTQAAGPPHPAVGVFPLDEVRPGLTGVARTVFEGEQIEQFGVEILGVYEDFAGPGQDVILARLTGDKVQHTGVVAGMSGSPVYIDGRLLGALSYRIGSFTKEPLVGITPIEKMLPVLDLPDAGAREAGRADLDMSHWRLPALPDEPGVAVEFLPRDEDRGRDLLSLPGQPALEAAQPSGGLPAPLRRIDTPLLFSGLEPAALEWYAPRLREMGLLPVQGGVAGTASGAPRPTRLEPGSAIAAQLARGDVQISATGTLTYLADGKVLAFGHPLLKSGATDIPFAPARVLMTVPSLDDSFKLASPGDSQGALRQDRLTAVGGRIGETARMIPVRLSVRAAGAAPRQVSFEVFQDPVWGPLILEIALAGSMVNALDFSQAATVTLRGTVRFEGHPELRLGNVFSGSGTPLAVQQVAIRYLTSAFSLLYGNRFESPRVRGVEVEVEQSPERNFTVVDDLWVSRSSVAPGEAVTVRVFLRPYRGGRIYRDFEVRVPAGLPAGTVSILAGGGQAFQRYDQRLLRQRLAQSESLDQMMEALSDLPRFDHLYVRLARRSEGGVLKQRLAPALPPSVLQVLRSSEAGGDFALLEEDVLSEQQLGLDSAIFGGQQLSLKVEPH